jgi:hypothetical protein
LINKKEEELKSLQEELGLIEQVFARNSLSNPATRIQTYRGAEGIRQMLWNELSSKTPLIGYHYRVLSGPIAKQFMERWAAEVEERQLHRKILVGNEYVESWQAHQAQSQRIEGTEYHYITPATFPITHSCDVFDNVTAYYNWKDNEIFGTEIYNQEIADSQRQLLEEFWQKSQPETRL